MGETSSARKRSTELKLRRVAGTLEGLQHVGDDGVSEALGESADGGAVFLDEAGDVLGGLELFAVAEGIVLVEDVAIACGEDDLSGDGEEIAGSLAAGGVVGKRRDGLAEDGAGEGGVWIGGSGIEDVKPGARIELAYGGLSEDHLRMISGDAGGEDGDSNGPKGGREVRGGPGDVVTATGKGEEEGKAGESHSLVHCRTQPRC